MLSICITNNNSVGFELEPLPNNTNYNVLLHLCPLAEFRQGVQVGVEGVDLMCQTKGGTACSHIRWSK